MKLHHVEVTNFKRLVVVKAAIGPHVTEVSGKNGAGKSSLLDALDCLFKGMSHSPAVPVRKGCEESIIRGRLGDLVVERKFKTVAGGEATSSITLRTPEGARYPRPQQHLDELFGVHMLDPLEFIKAKPDEQFQMLRRFVPQVDFEAIESANKGDYADRTDFNRYAKQERVQADVIEIPPGTPEQPVDESALLAELKAANDHNVQLERRKNNRERHERAIEQKKQAVAVIEGELADLERRLTEQRSRLVETNEIVASMQKQLDDAELLPEPVDTTAVMTKIEEARKVNANVAKRSERQKHIDQALQYERKSQELTDRMAARSAEKAKAIAEANIPVKGIGFGDRCVLLNDIPFQQASTAEQLATVFALIVALNPKVRLAWIRDASLLDDDMRATVERLAEQHDVQVLLETVRPGSASAIVLEEGLVKETKAQPSAAQGSLV